MNAHNTHETESEDAALLERARAGEPGALEALLDRYQSRVYRFGLRMCRDEEDAKDVLQNTLIALARGVRDFRGGASLSTWLYTVARSYCIKKRRKSKFAPEHEQSLDADETVADTVVSDDARTPDEALAGKQVEHALSHAIRELEPMYREVLILRDVEGLTAPEVAEVLGITVQAVKSRLHRARLTVRERVAPLLGVPDAAAAPQAHCPDVLTLFSRHVEDEISAEVCAQMERHLEQCPRCRGACDSLRRTLALCRTEGTPAHVPASVQASVKTALRNVLGESP